MYSKSYMDFQFTHDIWPWVALKGQIKVIGYSFNLIGLCIIDHVY